MTAISHRDLHDRFDDLLRAVEEGETFEITRDGTVVAVVSPPKPDPLEGLSYRPATTTEPFSEIGRVRVAESTADIMTELRGER